ncbi:MAG: fructosamine kinase family protein [Alkalispirochaeta sp.]
MSLRDELEQIRLSASSLRQAVVQIAGDGVAVRSERSVGGGSINDTRQVTLSNGRNLFLKVNSRAHGDLFAEEARGLLSLREAQGPRVPTPLGLFESGDTQYMLMEWIATGRPGGDFWSRFGRDLALLHRTNRSPRCGFFHDNHIGATEQPNGWMVGWHEFFGERRLLFQVELARKHGRADVAMEHGVRSLIKRLPELIPDLDEGGASILHGDLWGGNYMVSEDNEPVLIDPAVYYGHREADLAMTELFGGFSSAFYRAYQAEWPLVPGYEQRRDIYNLYHLLNHLNLFGGSYAGSCRAIIRRFS